MKFEENVPLAPLTTLQVGGPARYFLEAHTADEVHAGLAFARARALPVFILGGGSNILVADSGFGGLVTHIRILGITSRSRGDQVLVHAGAGVNWDSLVAWSIKRNCAGFECLSGVPGTVGGAVVANIGCYGAQMSDTFVSAEVLDAENPDRGVQILKKDECNFSYHDSVFSRTPGRYIILRATFALAMSGTAQLAYKDSRFDLSALAAKLGHQPTAAEVRGAVLDIREQKGQLNMEGRSSYRSAGSFFHMPFVSPETYQRVLARSQELDAGKEEQLRPWAWMQPDGSYKLAPGFLLEYTEFKKGYARGSVGISPKHTLTIITSTDARAKDIAQLASDMHAAVTKIFDVDLEREVEYVGDV